MNWVKLPTWGPWTPVLLWPLLLSLKAPDQQPVEALQKNANIVKITLVCLSFGLIFIVLAIMSTGYNSVVLNGVNSGDVRMQIISEKKSRRAIYNRSHNLRGLKENTRVRWQSVILWEVWHSKGARNALPVEKYCWREIELLYLQKLDLVIKVFLTSVNDIIQRQKYCIQFPLISPRTSQRC